MKDDNAIEREIQAKGLTAPRITPEDIEANIASEHYFTAYEGTKYGRITRDEPANSEALKALRRSVEKDCARRLRKIDLLIEGESVSVPESSTEANEQE